MAGLAPGGWGPVLTLFAMGGSTLIIGAIIDPLAGFFLSWACCASWRRFSLGIFGETQTDRCHVNQAS